MDELVHSRTIYTLLIHCMHICARMYTHSAGHMQLNSISVTMYLQSAATLPYILLRVFQSSKWKLNAHFIAIAELVMYNIQIPEFLNLHLVLSILNRT